MRLSLRSQGTLVFAAAELKLGELQIQLSRQAEQLQDTQADLDKASSSEEALQRTVTELQSDVGSLRCVQLSCSLSCVYGTAHRIY